MASTAPAFACKPAGSILNTRGCWHGRQGLSEHGRPQTPRRQYSLLLRRYLFRTHRVQYTPADRECAVTTSTGTQLLADALRVSASLGTDLRNATVGFEADLEPGVAPRDRCPRDNLADLCSMPHIGTNAMHEAHR